MSAVYYTYKSIAEYAREVGRVVTCDPIGRPLPRPLNAETEKDSMRIPMNQWSPQFNRTVGNNYHYEVNTLFKYNVAIVCLLTAEVFVRYIHLMYN